MKSLKIENFEREFAICADKDKSYFAIEQNELPSCVKKGDIILIDDEGKITLKK
ncbi:MULTISPECIES: DUF3006 domain-containing protein [unclassified Ruminococcus]|uniref:DUF3006 domain-containing protein n=1 Tax=unclassified Ruminococcus TaxID=2608920 RepID=UPI0021088C55|nr:MULTISPECIES: DUF3006 domain-containing protein [unclassified Ruminococcus]MCQ4022173.1 DUF3006 family protein [Ruminococcus sp. zg-924]MCQ4115571.1 DUF3006 family protein [Ruminococcus sp. zg-921]